MVLNFLICLLMLAHCFNSDTKMVTGEVKCRREPVRSQCPAKCSCSGGVVNCRNAGLMSIPADIPEYVEEL